MQGGVLARDLGCHLGWAYASPAAIASWPKVGFLGKGPLDGVEYGMEFLGEPGLRNASQRYSRFYRFNKAQLELYRPAHVVYERPFNKRQVGHIENIKLQGALDTFFEGHDVPAWALEISSIKKHFAGHGYASKDDVIFVCRRRGWDPADDNVADALAILDFGICMLDQSGILSAPPRLVRA